MTTITPEEIETLRDLADDSGDMEWRRWANALADKIEAIQAESARLKSLIEQSANEWTWIVDDAGMYLIGPGSSGPKYRKRNGRWVHVYDDSIVFDDPVIARAWTENRQREKGHMKPIDIIHVRQRDVEAAK